MSSIPSDLQDKIKRLKRRRDFLSSRLADYKGKNNSHDRAEESAINFAIIVIENNYQNALDILAEMRKEKERKKRENNERLS